MTTTECPNCQLQTKLMRPISIFLIEVEQVLAAGIKLYQKESPQCVQSCQQRQ